MFHKFSTPPRGVLVIYFNSYVVLSQVENTLRINKKETESLLHSQCNAMVYYSSGFSVPA